MTAPSVSTCLWFESGAEQAATLYCSLFPDGRITTRMPVVGDPNGGAFLVEFSLMGQCYTAMNGGPHYKLSPAASISVLVDTQAEVDHLWTTLLQGGSESRCGWLVDRFGLSWQIIPRTLPRLLKQDTSGKVMRAMMGMVKLDIAALEAAAQA